jgi:hypothetical protein
MTPEVYESLVEISQAMDRFNKSIDAWIEGMRRNQAEPDRVKRLSGGARAMRDSGQIYLAWAEHLANGMPEDPMQRMPPTSEQ